MGQKIGVLGGTFDPVHIGHLIVAQEAADLCGLEQVLFVPAAVPPHKRGPEIADAELRCQMVQLAISDNPRFALSRVEIDREGVSYTVDTLRLLQASYGSDTRLYLIVGRDNAEEMSTWSQPRELVQLAQVVVADRPNAGAGGDPDLLKRMTFLDTARLELSSTEVRQRVAAGRSFRYLVPDDVADLIHSQQLYK